MGWFFKVAAQWCIIAILVSLPFRFPNYWPWLTVFCWTLAFGLVTYGIFNPKYAIRRVLLWGCGTVIASAVAPNTLQPEIRSYLEVRDTPESLLATYDVLSTIFLNASVSWWVYIVLLTLATLELVRILKDDNNWFGKNKGIHISQSGQNGTISKWPENTGSHVLKATFILTNSEGSPIQVTRSRLSIFFVNLDGELYATGYSDEISGEHPFKVPQNESQEFSIVCRRLPKFLNWLVNLCNRSGLKFLLDMTGHVKAFGHNGMSDQSQRIIFNF